MSDQNKKLARRFYDEALSQKNLGVLDQLFAPNIVDHNPLPGQAAGLQGLKNVMSEFLQGFPDLRLTVEAMIAEGDFVAARFAGQGTHKGPILGAPATGKKVSFHGTDMIHIKDGKVVEVWHEGNDFAVMMELGVPVSAGVQS